MQVSLTLLQAFLLGETKTALDSICFAFNMTTVDDHALQDLIHQLEILASQDMATHGATYGAIDGVRAEYADGFGLARASNTTPVIVLRFEADTAQALERIQGEFRSVLQKLKPGSPLPF